MALITRGIKTFSGTEDFAPDDPANIARSAELDTDFDIIYGEFNGNIGNANIASSAAIAGAKLNLANYIINAHIAVGADINASKLLNASILEAKIADDAVTRPKIIADAATQMFEDLSVIERTMNFTIPSAGAQSGYFDLIDLRINGLNWPTDNADILVWFSMPFFGTTTPAGVTGAQNFEARCFVDDGVSTIKSAEQTIVQGLTVIDPASPVKFFPQGMWGGMFLIPNVTPKSGAPFWDLKVEIQFGAFVDGSYTFLANPQTTPGSGNHAAIHALVRHR